MSDRQPMLYARVPPETLEQAQNIADREYDGNLSLLVRIAVKRLVASVLEREGADETATEAAAS